MSNRPTEIFEYGYINPRLKPLPLIDADVQWRKSTEAKADAAKKDSQLGGCKSGKRAKGAFSNRYETRIHVETEIHSRALVNSAGSEFVAVLRLHLKE